MKINKILILVIFFLNNNCIVQAQSFEKDWQWLKFTEKTTGTASSVYENALLKIVPNNLQDSLMVSYYDSIATRLTAIIPQIEKKYGITSTQYFDLIDGCSIVLLESAQNNVRKKSRKQLIRFLKSLETNYQRAGENKYIFIVGLSDVYRYLGNVDKAIYWAQKRYDYAPRHDNDIDLSGAYSVLSELYVKYHKDADLAILCNNLIKDTIISQKEKRSIINYVLNAAYNVLPISIKTDIVTDLLKSKETKFLDLKILCSLATENKDYYIFNMIENSQWFLALNIEDKFDYYDWNSTFFSVYNNHQWCIDYLLKAIYHAQANNRDDLNWKYIGSKATEKTHNWALVAIRYEYYLSDKKNAIKYSQKNVAAIKDYYGENSIQYYKELKLLANKYDLWYNDIEKVSQYDSVVVEVSKQIFGIESEEYANSLASYVFCLRRQQQYDKALSLCTNYLLIANTAHSHIIYNQAALCCKALDMREEAINLYLIAIDKANNTSSKSSYADNLSSLLMDGENAKEAMDFVEKYKIQTDNAISNYILLNNEANMLAYTNRNKAYQLFCEAEKYEMSPSVQLLIDRQINHYLDKAKVAPDLHIKFASLQQALKLFDNNNTKDSIMYAYIIADMADYYNSVMDVEKAALLYKQASDVYIRNSKEISIDFIDFGDRVAMFWLSKGYYSQWVPIVEQLLAMRKQMQGEMNNIYALKRFQLLDTYSRFGYDSKADSLAKELKNAQLPPECEKERDYYLGLYELQSRKDFKKAAIYFEKYLTWGTSIAGIRIYGDLLDIYKELKEFNKFDNMENKYISMWYQDIESQWYHLTDLERHNFLRLLKGWQISLAKYACTPQSIENAANASLFCKGRLTKTTKAINEELSRLGKHNNLSESSIPYITEANVGDGNNINISDLIISNKDSVNRGIIYDNLSIKRLESLVNSSISHVRKNLLKGDVGIDFINVDTTTIYAYLIRKDEPVELKQLCLNVDKKTLSPKSLEYLSLGIKNAKRIFFSPSELLSVSPMELFFKRKFPNVEIHRVMTLSSISKHNDVKIKKVVAIGNPRFNDEPINHSTPKRGIIWQPLPGTKIEIDSISILLKNKDIQIHTYTENNATESVIKDYNSQDVEIVHIATHGFFNSDNNSSGLLFTGANRGLNGDILNNTDDGILTCDEIEKLHFPNLKLVVLSACDTGLGKTNIDGVWGLQRAFRIAGAQNMIVSLKKVDDELTQAFMIKFYKNLTSGKSIYDSFWEAMDNADEDTRNSFILIE